MQLGRLSQQLQPLRVLALNRCYQLKHSYKPIHCFPFDQRKAVTLSPSQLQRSEPLLRRVFSVLLMKGKESLQVFQARYISKKNYEFPKIEEADLEESFVRGSGPGGQSINKTASCVVLKHLPTGIVVKNQESRSLQTNRKRAREVLTEQLDLKINGDNSYIRQLRREESEAKAQKKTKSKKNLEIKKAFKEREGLK